MARRSIGTAPLIAAALALAAPAAAQDAYKVGVIAALTGPGAGTQQQVIEALRIYVDALNAKGGVGGKKIELLIQDDQTNAQKAAADAKKLIGDDVVLLINSTLSSSYAPMIAEAKRAKVPLYFGGSVCPRETHPKADPGMFCSTAFGAGYDSRFGLALAKELSGGNAKVGMITMAIPVARTEIEVAVGIAKTLGLEVVANESVPPPTADYSAVATKVKDSGATWGYSWSPWVTQVRTFEALRNQGWNGGYLAYAHINAEDELARVKDEKFIVFGANAFFQDNLPVHQEIRAAAQKAGTKIPVTQLAEGWVVGMTVEAILAKTGWPATREKVTAAMQAVTVDTKGLRGAPITWTADNHFRTKQCYRAYRWDTAKSAVVRVKDWTCYDVQ